MEYKIIIRSTYIRNTGKRKQHVAVVICRYGTLFCGYNHILTAIATLLRQLRAPETRGSVNNDFAVENLWVILLRL